LLKVMKPQHAGYWVSSCVPIARSSKHISRPE
jgi:hypothetical protein